ncbi:TIR domain-containing protein [Rhizobiales bacterium GAS113]|nr:TIR domain-containing protein [Rhizobiales bacterium GAS113]
MAVKIFISYARLDDEAPPGLSQAEAYVTFLRTQLQFQLCSLGEPCPYIWVDRREVEASDQFDDVISQAISESSILVVVLSRNWLGRPYCLKELDWFAQRWGKEGQNRVKKRIIVLNKNLVKSEQRPPLLQGQVGHNFFAVQGKAELGREEEFFVLGRPKDERYTKCIVELASLLWRRAQAPTADFESGTQVSAPNGETFRSTKNARTIYLAHPADDMRLAYSQLEQELQRRGYAVVPNGAIPQDSSATEFVDRALASAELSVHLVGEKPGYAPEDSDRIVKLQLARALLRASASAARRAENRDFRRIIWAPKTLVAPEGAASATTERDPVKVLSNFDSMHETDKIEGGTLSKFVDFLLQHLVFTTPAMDGPNLIEADARVYLCHCAEDSDYVLHLAKALQDRKIEPLLPAFEGPPAEVKRFNDERLLECNAVVLCWAEASEVWVRAQSNGLRDWQRLGRAERFAYRGLVAGPPMRPRKKFFVEMPPRSEIDLVLDLTAVNRPSPELIDPLVRIVQPKNA